VSSSVSTAPRVARGPQGPPRQGPGRRHTNRSRRRCVSPLGSCCRRRGHLVHAPRGSKNSVRARTSILHSMPPPAEEDEDDWEDEGDWDDDDEGTSGISGRKG
jgi:hypothetical protein